MITNPKTVSWGKPTANMDGSPIDYDLDYELGVAEVVADGVPLAAPSPLMTIVGSLQPDATYQAPLGLSGLKDGVGYHLYMRDFSHTDLSRVSSWAEAADTIMFLSPPNPPANFTVA